MRRTLSCLVCLGALSLVSVGCADGSENPFLTAGEVGGLDGLSGQDGQDVTSSDLAADPGPADNGSDTVAPDVAVDTPESDTPNDDVGVDSSVIDTVVSDADATTDTPTDEGGADGIIGDGGLGDVIPLDDVVVDVPTVDVPTVDVPTVDVPTVDVVVDVPTVDVVFDVPTVDGGVDIAKDTGVDIAKDTGIDVPTVDTGVDVPVDSGPDINPAGCPNTPTCFQPAAGAPDSELNLLDEAAPTLAGGTVPNGWYQLDSIDMYIGGSFSGFVQSVDVTSNGNTFGSIEVTDDNWAVAANLDIQIALEIAFVGAFDQPLNTPLAGGGCYTIAGNEIVADFLQCGGTWIAGVAAPGAFDYETGTDTMSVQVVLTVEMITTFLPADFQGAASLAITGPIPLILNFSKP